MSTRGQFLVRAGLAAAAAAFLMGARRKKRRRMGSPSTPANGRPNILFVLTDDQPPGSVRGMRRTMARFSGGLDLTDNGYAAVPLCGPARASLLTGRYPHSHGVLTNFSPGTFRAYRARGLQADDLLTRMDRAGYDVGFFGKYMNGYGAADDPTGGRFVSAGADRWHALVGSQYADLYEVNNDGRAVGGVAQNHTPYFGGFAESFMKNRAGSPAAWFCYLNFTDPHGPWEPLKAFEGTHDGETYSSPGTEETDFSDKSAHWSRLSKLAPGSLQRINEGVLEELEGVDHWVDRLFGMLQATGQLENTVVIFSSDNGWMRGEHGGISGKSLPYEESARVPFLVRGPGLSGLDAGGKLVSHLDLTATILALARADTSGVEGRDLRGIGGEWRKRLLVEHPEAGWAMVREGSHAYADFSKGGEEMYDLAADPHQLESLHADPAHAAAKAALEANLTALRSSAGGALRTAETAP